MQEAALHPDRAEEPPPGGQQVDVAPLGSFIEQAAAKRAPVDVVESEEVAGDKRIDEDRYKRLCMGDGVEIVRPTPLPAAVATVATRPVGVTDATDATDATVDYFYQKAKDEEDRRLAAVRAEAEAKAEAKAVAATAPAVQARNASTLALKNPLRGDDTVTFEEEGHKYTVHGGPVDRSTTRVLADYFEQFDPVVNTNTYYDRWKNNSTHKYHARIHEVLDGGGSDEDARAAIRGDWKKLGDDASRLGTLFHLYAETFENDELDEVVGSTFKEIDHEAGQFHDFKASAWTMGLGLEPVRTELCVYHRIGELNVCAGQVDMLYRDKSGAFYLIDWKCTAKHHTLNASDTAYNDRRGLGPMAHLPDTDYQRYSLQTSTYNLMLLSTHGVDVGERMFLVRVHADRAEHELVKCRDLRNEAQAMLDGEWRRLTRAGAAGAGSGA